MFGKLLTKIKAIGKQSKEHVWCVACKDYVTISIDGYKSKGSSTRMLGTCRTCTGTTSTFVASA